MNLQEIQCAVCRKPVEQAEAWEDKSNQTFKVRVRCHGASQTCELDHDFLALAGPFDLVAAEAFAQPALMGAT